MRNETTQRILEVLESAGMSDAVITIETVDGYTMTPRKCQLEGPDSTEDGWVIEIFKDGMDICLVLVGDDAQDAARRSWQIIRRLRSAAFDAKVVGDAV